MKQITFSEWSQRVRWPLAVGACVLSWLGHRLAIQLVLLASATMTHLSAPPAAQTLLLLPTFLGLLLFLSLAVGRFLAHAIQPEEPRQATVVAYGFMGLLYSFFAISSSALVLGWCLVNILLSMIGAGLAHKVQWLKIPGAMAKLFEVRPRS